MEKRKNLFKSQINVTTVTILWSGLKVKKIKDKKQNKAIKKKKTQQNEIE